MLTLLRALQFRFLQERRPQTTFLEVCMRISGRVSEGLCVCVRNVYLDVSLCLWQGGVCVFVCVSLLL